MFIVQNYPLAVIFCMITMLCWGSWANTQKLAGKTWRFELFYWDYVIGIFIFSVLSAFTLGSVGKNGRSFLTDLQQADATNMLSALLGGFIFNAATYRKASTAKQGVSTKGIIISLVAGVLMSFFYRFIAASMDLENFEQPAPGKMTPYTAVFIFSLGVFLSNFIFNTILMKKPLQGSPTGYKEYFHGSFGLHMVGVLGGLIWGLGNSLNLIAAGKAGPAISYGLGQGATLIAALWGVFIWKEFQQAPKGTNGLIVAMFLFFVVGLGLLIYAGT
ncbi:MAG: multidrug DMT transporter permease [Bacteroidetes bacterium]|nr:MAG: multidrug DMT transporter permease [Bacteroidota bacterium]